MDADQYLAERVQDQIDWHSKKSSANQRNFKRLQVVIIIASALLPLLAGFQGDSYDLRLVIGGIGVLVAILTGLLSLYRFQDLWVEYRLTAESLTQEKYRFLTGAPPYDSGDTLGALVERVESILSDQNSQWQHIAKAEPRETQRPDEAPEEAE